MEEKLILHKPISPPNKGDIIIQLTDIQLHRNADKTDSPGKRVEHAIDNNKPGRIRQKLLVKEGNIIQTPFFDTNDPSLQAMVRKYQQQGKRVFIQKPPKEGLPVFLGDDAVQFMNSKKGKRILRKINKDKDK